MSAYVVFYFVTVSQWKIVSYDSRHLNKVRFFTKSTSGPYTEQLKKKVTLSHVHNEVTSEPTITRYTTVRKTRGKMFRVAAARVDRVAKWGLRRKKAFCILPFCNTVSPGGGGPKHFQASITNKL
jgi:hypothetical protein